MKRKLCILLSIVLICCLAPVTTARASYENTYVNTGNQIEDIIGVAQTQLGYLEGNNSSQLGGTVAGSGNYTKYGQWYGINPGAWCAMFVSWCANQAGISAGVIPRHASCDVGMNWFKNNARWGWGSYWAGQRGYTAYTPKRGDIVYYGNGNLDDSTHVGIVTSVSGGKIYTIEGNASDKCQTRSYSLTSSYIYGYGIPAYSGSGTIVTPTGPSSISLANANYPTALNTGSSFSIRGTVNSNYRLSWVRASVWNSVPEVKISSYTAPDTTSYSLTGLDNALKFGQLSAGYYIYVVEAIDSEGVYAMLMMEPFTVGGASGSFRKLPFQVTTSGGTLNIRSEASASSTRLGSVENGAIINVERIENGWAYANVNGVAGWLSMTYLMPDFTTIDPYGSGLNPATPTPSPTPRPTASPTPKPTAAPTAAPTASPTPTAAPTEAPAEGVLETAPGSGYSIENGLLLGVGQKTTPAALSAGLIAGGELEIVPYAGSYVGTGSVVRLHSGGAVTAEDVVVVSGDTNGDSRITSIDYLLIKRYMNGAAQLDGAFLNAADMDGTDTVTSSDYLKIKRIFNGLA